MTRTIWWEDNQVKMIDQRILPLHYEILGYADYRGRGRSDHRHGGARRAGHRRGGRHTAWRWPRCRARPATATAC